MKHFESLILFIKSYGLFLFASGVLTSFIDSLTPWLRVAALIVAIIIGLAKAYLKVTEAYDHYQKRKNEKRKL